MIKKIYRETVFKSIPEKWIMKSLVKVAKIERGRFSHRPRNDPSFYGGNIPFLQTNDVVKSNGFITEYDQTLNQKGLSVSKLFPKDTIVLTIAANIGDTGILKFPACFPDSLVGIIPNNILNAQYLEYYLRTQKKVLKYFAPKSAQKNINLETLKPLPIPIPPIPEQKKIAAILSSVDRVIETTQEAISQLQKVKRGLMQQLLTKGIPGWNKEYKNTVIGKIPDGWNLMTLEDVGTWKSGGTPSKKNQTYWNGSIPWVSAKDMKCDRLSKTIDYITDLGAASGTQVVSSGSILVVVRGMILAHSFPVTLTLQTVAFNQDIKALIPSEKFLSEFILYWLQYNRNNILALVSEATHGTKRLLQEELLSFPIPHSPIPEQKKISGILTSIDKRIEAEEAKKAQVEKIKQGLMQQLLVGKIRVKF